MFIRTHLFLLFLIAPVIGFFTAFYEFHPFENARSSEKLHAENTFETLQAMQSQMKAADETISKTQSKLNDIQKQVQTQKEEYEEQNQKLSDLFSSSQSQTEQSHDVLDNILANKLGEPIGQTYGDQATVKVFSLKESGYRGYMAKVKLHNPHALKMVLAHNKKVSDGETTLEAAQRKGAVLAVNAGGFTKTSAGTMYPLGTTVIDGQVRSYSETADLRFVGFNKNGRLVGGQIQSKQQIQEMNILQGASFLPRLLKNGEKLPIPDEWANERHPRTLIGHFSNGDLLFIVIDGRRENWSDGVTLEEAQTKLLEFSVTDAFNLDGGGSSTFYYDGKVLNKPSDGTVRPVTTNLVVLP